MINKEDMNRAFGAHWVVLLVVITLVVGSASFTAGVASGVKKLNDVAHGNYLIALASFREDYQVKRIRIYGEFNERSVFSIDEYEFVVLPAGSESPGATYSNMARHANGMVIMLASTWTMDGDPRAGMLWAKLKEYIPKFPLWGPANKGTVGLSDFDSEVIRELMKSEAGQWRMRMNDEI